MGGWVVYTTNEWWAQKPEDARRVSNRFAESLRFASRSSGCYRLDHGERITADFPGADPQEVRVFHSDGSPPAEPGRYDDAATRSWPISAIENDWMFTTELRDWLRAQHPLEMNPFTREEVLRERLRLLRPT
jgi:hypothetical protein